MSKIWSREESADNNVWDDTELVKMYEDSLRSTSASSGIRSKDYTTPEGKKYTWKIGAQCMAPYQDTENAETEWFPAIIQKICGPDDEEVAVTFEEYGNTEIVHMKDIYDKSELEETATASDVVMASPKAEKVPVEREKTQRRRSGRYSNGPSSSFFNQGPSIPVIAPPPPPGVLNMVPPSEVEALSSMLMSWYMSGYHTGYYKAISDQKKEQKQ